MNTAPRRKSALHRRIVELIHEAFPKFNILEEHSLKVQMSGFKTTVFVDIVVKELKLAIEVQGKQHYEFNPHFHQTRATFAQAVERDQAKALTIKDASYTYMAIKFDEIKDLTVVTFLKKVTEAISQGN
jgi:very-short-patch-repair endonuclease